MSDASRQGTGAWRGGGTARVQAAGMSASGHHTAAGHDPSDPATAHTDRRAGYLALFAVYARMRAALENEVNFAVAGALAGSNCRIVV